MISGGFGRIWGVYKLVRFYHLFWVCFVITILFSPHEASADCTNPAKPEGTIIYNTDHKVAQFCNGTQWVGMAGGTTSIMEGDTMVDGWPDAILCERSSSDFMILFHNFTFTDGRGLYRFIQSNEASGNYDITFNSDKTYNTHNNLAGSSCQNKSISQLYTDGQAFNFVGGQPVQPDTLSSLNCTDGQMVLYDTATTAWVCADVSASGAADNLGNHTATQDLDMANHAIQNVAGIDLDLVAGGAAPKSSGGSGVPSGFIGAFDLAACPDGWSEYTAARGRFPRGIDPTGTNDPDGVRTAGSVQEDAFQGHRHQAYDVGGTAGVSSGSYVNVKHRTGSTDSSVVLDPISDGSSGSPRVAEETRPKNFAVLYCRKD